MMKDYTFLAIPYLLLSSSLYHIAFWGTFDINGLAYIGISDLIKSVAFPFSSFGSSMIFGIIASEVLFRINDWIPVKSAELPTEGLLRSGAGRNSNIGRKLNSPYGILASLTVWATLVVLLYYFGSESRWIIWAGTVVVAPYIFLDRIGFLNKQIANNTIRQFSIRMFLLVPILLFAAGKYDGELIYRNVRYKYINNQGSTILNASSSIDCTKLIGITTSFIFLSDLKNREIFIINSDKIDVLQLSTGGSSY